MNDFPKPTVSIPYVTTEQMIEVDRAMLEDYHIALIQMMENAGRTLANVARVRFLDGNPSGKHVVIMAGAGGNGGGALVCARRLKNYGASVQVFLTKPADAFTPISTHQLDVVTRMGISSTVGVSDLAAEPDLIVDGVIGYSLKGAPRGKAKILIEWANAQQAPILSLDAPSGVDTTTGTVFDPAINAAATMTLALPKEGLRAEGVSQQVGDLYLADISVPPALYAGDKLNFEVGPIFAQSDIIKLTD